MTTNNTVSSKKLNSVKATASVGGDLLSGFKAKLSKYDEDSLAELGSTILRKEESTKRSTTFYLDEGPAYMYELRVSVYDVDGSVDVVSLGTIERAEP